MVQKIAIIGGTGMTGQCVVDYALSKGEKYRILFSTQINQVISINHDSKCFIQIHIHSQQV